MAELFKRVILSEDLVLLGEQDISLVKLEKLNAIEQAPEIPILKEQARETGFKLGFSQGHTEGIKQAQEQIKTENLERLEQIHSLLQGISQALCQSRLALQNEVADIVLMISQQFFVHQQQQKGLIAEQILTALNQINDKQALTLLLNPKDFALLEQGELNMDLSSYPALCVKSDERLALGGCMIRCEHGLFDAGIERQIDCLKKELLDLKNRNHYEGI
ncbi:MAG: hypothetical protein H0U70_03240 [Tatlockia sp.]|nr:hypothetical protein [Tatlockia sp.]